MAEKKFFILQTGIGKARAAIFEKQLTDKLGVKLCKSLEEDVTHVVVDDMLEASKIHKLLRLEANEGENIKFKIVKSKWISCCINRKEFIDSHEFEVTLPKGLRQSVESNKECLFIDKSQKIEETKTTIFKDTLCEPEKKKSRWVCMNSSKSDDVNYNKSITDELEKLMKTYENMNEKWRALSYRKAIASLKTHTSPITSYQEALSLPGIGVQLAEKICEIVESGKLRKLVELNDQESIKSLEVFTKVWGAGPHTAKVWVAQGFRTLEDLASKASLTRHQEIGLKYYDDLSEKMTRHEAEDIGNHVREVAVTFRPGCEVVICGSFRRGRNLCGDVDVLVTHQDGNSHVGLFDLLVEELKSSGFITDQLLISNSGEQHKYLGICKLPQVNSKHRRIDIIVVPHDEFFPALVYFTGSGHFNRSMRNLASRKGMSLNEHGLFKNVIRNKEGKVNKGTKIPTLSEKSIFDCLDVPYRPPEERDF